MFRSGLRYVRGQHAGLLALVVVGLGGTAYAAATIGSRDVINNSLKSKDYRTDSVRPSDIDDSHTWTDVTDFTSDWQIQAPGLQCYRDGLGIVHFRGVVKRAADTVDLEQVVDALPGRCRPSRAGLFPVAIADSTFTGDEAGVLFINTDGTAYLDSANASVGEYLSFDGVTYPAH